MRWLAFILLLSQLAFAQETEEERRARERILNQYGNAQQVAEAEKAQKERHINEAVENYRQQLQNVTEQTDDNRVILNLMRNIPVVTEEESSQFSAEDYALIKTRRMEVRQEMMSQYSSRGKKRNTQVDLNDGGVYTKDANGNLVKVENPEEVIAAEPAPGTEDAPAQPTTPEEQISKFYQDKGIDDNFISKMMDKKMKEQMEQLMKSNPLSLMSKEEISAKIEENTANSKLGNILKSKPKLKELLVNFAHDKDALPGLISIINKPGQMKTYGICVFCILVGAFIFNLLNTKGSLIKRIFTKLALGASTFVLNIGCFYFLFKEEVTPSIEVFKSTFGL